LCLSALHDEAAAPVLLVEDEGVGIPPEDVDSIFQPFRGSFGKGTGLGLAIVHRIVTDYGGSIEVRPRPGGGTVFRVSFPRRADLGAELQAS
jgi:signal transduction histidine kinase